MWQYIIIAIAFILVGYGIWLGVSGARIEENPIDRRGLVRMFIGGILIAIAALIVTIAAKLLG